MPIRALLALLGALLMAGGLTAYGVTQRPVDREAAPDRRAETAPQAGAVIAEQAPPAKPGAVPAEQTTAPTAPAPADEAAPSTPGEGGAAPAPQRSASQDAVANPVAKANPTPPAGAKPSEILKPTFDVVRVEPTGDAVVAGQGAPGATVELLRNGQSFARAVADVGGQWAIVPPRLPPGAAELALRVTTPDGRTVISAQVVSVEVPSRPGDPVLVVLNSPDTPSKVLSGVSLVKAAATPATGATTAGTATTAAASAGPRADARIVTVEADQSGRFFVSGTAQPGAEIRIYLNDAPVAKVKAAGDGRFGLAVEHGVVAGTYRVRADDIDAKTGKVLTRAEVPFTMQAGQVVAGAPRAVVVAQGGPAASAQPGGATDASAIGAGSVGEAAGATTPAGQAPASSTSVAVVPEIKTVTIAQGDNLWRLSRKIYGRGTRYTVIYGANTTQIRDPGKIFPGQIFVLPSSEKS